MGTIPLCSAVDVALGGGSLRLVQYNINRVCRLEDAWRGYLGLEEGLKLQSIPQQAQSLKELWRVLCGVVVEFLTPAVRLQRVFSFRKP
jgi:hypothetical protein